MLVVLCPPQTGRAAAAVPEVIQILRADIAAKPSRVLIVVEDALTMDERAACEIVTQALLATGADPKLTGEIVATALRHAPGMAAQIVDCALAARPAAAAEIRSAMSKILGASTEATAEAAVSESEEPQNSGKVPARAGKSVVPAVRAVAAPFSLDGFDVSTVGIGGIYLLTPSARFYGPCTPDDLCCSEDLSRACLDP